jgi:hypothetical protein
MRLRKFDGATSKSVVGSHPSVVAMSPGQIRHRVPWTGTNQFRIKSHGREDGGVGMNWELQLARPLRTHRCGLPELVRTLGDALDLIDENLPEIAFDRRGEK